MNTSPISREIQAFQKARPIPAIPQRGARNYSAESFKSPITQTIKTFQSQVKLNSQSLEPLPHQLRRSTRIPEPLKKRETGYKNALNLEANYCQTKSEGSNIVRKIQQTATQIQPTFSQIQRTTSHATSVLKTTATKRKLSPTHSIVSLMTSEIVQVFDGESPRSKRKLSPPIPAIESKEDISNEKVPLTAQSPQVIEKIESGEFAPSKRSRSIKLSSHEKMLKVFFYHQFRLIFDKKPRDIKIPHTDFYPDDIYNFDELITVQQSELYPNSMKYYADTRLLELHDINLIISCLQKNSLIQSCDFKNFSSINGIPELTKFLLDSHINSLIFSHNLESKDIQALVELFKARQKKEIYLNIVLLNAESRIIFERMLKGHHCK